MFKGMHEMQRLGVLLEAELNGRHYDGDELRRLAGTLAEMYPAMAGTLVRAMERNGESRLQRSA